MYQLYAIIMLVLYTLGIMCIQLSALNLDGNDA